MGTWSWQPLPGVGVSSAYSPHANDSFSGREAIPFELGKQITGGRCGEKAVGTERGFWLSHPGWRSQATNIPSCPSIHSLPLHSGWLGHITHGDAGGLYVGLVHGSTPFHLHPYALPHSFPPNLSFFQNNVAQRPLGATDALGIPPTAPGVRTVRHPHLREQDTPALGFNPPSLPSGNVINTNCSAAHSRQALSCKMAVEYDKFIESGRK